MLVGFARKLERYQHRVEVVEELEQHRVDDGVDVALYETFAQHEAETDAIDNIVANPMNSVVAVYTWNLQQPLIDAALARGARGDLSTSMIALELVEAIERLSRGETVLSSPARRVRINSALDWPDRGEGLTDRESEVLAPITQCKTNDRIADLTHLSSNTIKTHIRTTYRKIGAHSRVEAVLWGIRNGFKPDHGGKNPRT